jgi:hypothetical protein
MSKLFWFFIKAAPAVVGASSIAFQSASAFPGTEIETRIAQALPNEQTGNGAWERLRQRNESKRLDGQLNEGNSMEQIINVSDLQDVAPTEWTYEALRGLVERYGCIVGYPDRTYRGNKALSRWEFAAGLNACMNVMERLIQENVTVLKEDVETLKRLAQEFEAELAALGARVDNLEGRVSFLEDHQFSTTTKLNGEVIFAVSDTFGNPVGKNDDTTQTTFSDRVRLNFDTSFTGKDRLRTRLQASNITRWDKATGTDMTRLAFDASDDTNDIILDDLYYRFPIGSQLTAWAGTTGLDLDDVFDPVNPFLADSGTGALSRFSRYNPFIYRGPQGAGAAVKFKISDAFNVTATYLTDPGSASNPAEGQGIFNGSFSTGVQLGVTPFEDLNLAVSYVHSYQNASEVNLTGSTGSAIAKKPFGNTPTTAERFGLQGSWRVLDQINLAAWGGYILANTSTGANDERKADLWTWNANLSVVDLGKEGAVLSLGGGLLPRAAYVEGGTRDPNASYIIEAAYKFPVTDNIIITPGAYVILDPEHNKTNDDIWVGIVRTTFKF